MINLKDIMSGHYKEVRNENVELAESRLRICEKCPLYKETFLGPMCNNKWLDVKTKEVFDTNIKGRKMYKGCMCRLDSKTRLENSKCPAKFW